MPCGAVPVGGAPPRRMAVTVPPKASPRGGPPTKAAGASRHALRRRTCGRRALAANGGDGAPESFAPGRASYKSGGCIANLRCAPYLWEARPAANGGDACSKSFAPGRASYKSGGCIAAMRCGAVSVGGAPPRRTAVTRAPKASPRGRASYTSSGCIANMRCGAVWVGGAPSRRTAVTRAPKASPRGGPPTKSNGASATRPFGDALPTSAAESSTGLLPSVGFFGVSFAPSTANHSKN